MCVMETQDEVDESQSDKCLLKEFLTKGRSLVSFVAHVFREGFRVKEEGSSRINEEETQDCHKLIS